MRFRGSGKWWIIVALLVAVALTLFASTASAHGGEGDHFAGPAPAWMIGLTYVQLIMIPPVGLWLLREAIASWWKPWS